MGIKKVIRKKGEFVCIFLYMFAWFIFGCLYCYIANITEGGSFVFQEDILLQTKNSELQANLGIKIDPDITKDLFLDYNKNFVPTKIASDTPMITFNITTNGIKPIGMLWSNYYIAKWKSQDYNFCSAELLKRHQRIIGNSNYCKLKFTVYQIPEDTFSIISSNKLIYLPEFYKILIQKQESFYLWVDEKEFKLYTKDWTFTGNKYTYAELDLSRVFISHAVNYLDDAIDIIYRYETQKHFNYPLIDFLYFSAVTITALGYGDILPNSSLVRGLVMTETILGTIILAISISYLYDRIKRNI